MTLILILKFLLLMSIVFDTIAVLTAFISAWIEANRPTEYDTVRTLDWVGFGFIFLIVDIVLVGIATVWQLVWGIP